MQTQYVDAQTIQEYLKHKDMIFIPDLDPNNCIYKEYGGRLYLLFKNDNAEAENSESAIILKDIKNNKDISINSFSKESIPSVLNEYGFRIRDFELNDKYFVFNTFIFLYVFKKENDSYKYLKQINIKKTYDCLSIEGSKLKLISCSVHNGQYEGEYQIIDLEAESLSDRTPLYSPNMWRFLYFQPKQLANFFQGSFMQSEIVRPVLYFQNKEGMDTVSFGTKDWIPMPDSIANKINSEYTDEADKFPKMVIDNLRKYLKQYSFIHKLFSLSSDKILVVWSVPSKRKLYDYRYTILQKEAKKVMSISLCKNK